MNGTFRPTATWQILELRANLLKRVRAFFDERGFLEVETPLLSADTVVDLHLDPIPLTLAYDPVQPTVGRSMFLQTSPEFCMKRLLAAEGRPIYQICKAFRLGESGAQHNPEFTMVEWYRPGDDDRAGRKLLDELCQTVLESKPSEQLTYRDAFLNHMGVNPHTAVADELATAAKRQSAAFSGFRSDDKDSWLDAILVECIQPELGQSQPTILYDYPASQSALAQTRLNESGEEVAARFELFIAGVELANGYHELRDADVLRQRMRETNQRRMALGKPKLPEDNRLLAAMEAGLPECSGCALGFDRLVMVAAGATTIAEVLAFPSDRA